MDPLILAHRGSQKINGFPENTIPAFQEALDLGAHGIELDIRLTADREIIVFHDSDLNRQFGIRQKISQLSLQQIRGFNFSTQSGTEKIPIPLLGEVFKKFGLKFYYNLEVKPTRASYRPLIRHLIQLIEEFDLSKNVWISSFDPYFLWLWHKYKPNIPTGYLFEKFTLTVSWVCRHSFIRLLHPGIQIANSTERLLGFDKKLCFWTVNLLEEYNRVKKLQPVAIISDDISIFSELLKNKIQFNFSEISD
jgi:glycerophosphoryl diester phosphodiesterase